MSVGSFVTHSTPQNGEARSPVVTAHFSVQHATVDLRPRLQLWQRPTLCQDKKLYRIMSAARLRHGDDGRRDGGVNRHHPPSEPSWPYRGKLHSDLSRHIRPGTQPAFGRHLSAVGERRPGDPVYTGAPLESPVAWPCGKIAVFKEAIRVPAKVGLPQQDLGTVAGLSVHDIGKIEIGGIAAPRPFPVRLLADAFGLAGDERERYAKPPAPKR
jgi:hypothetical protein